MKEQLLALVLLAVTATLSQAQTHTVMYPLQTTHPNVPTQLEQNAPHIMEQQLPEGLFPQLSTAEATPLFDSIYYWAWSELTAAWKAQARGKMTGFVYDVNNNLLNEVYQLLPSSLNSARYTYTYNSNNNRLTSLTETWEDYAWFNSSRFTYTYDSNNNQLTSLEETWNPSGWVNSRQITYTYDSNNNRLSTLDRGWVNGFWINSSREAYTYDSNNNQLSFLVENWDGSTWVNYYRDTYTYDADNNQLSFHHETWDGSVWFNPYQEIYTYDSNNNLLTNNRQAWGGSVWEPQSQYTYTYDINNSMLSYLGEVWEWGSSTWANDNQATYTYDINNNQLGFVKETWYDGSWRAYHQEAYTYDEDNFKESYFWKYQDPETGNVIWGDSVRYYFHSIVTGINEHTPTAAQLAYPNPSNGMFQVATQGVTAINVFDTQGRSILERRPTGAITTIDLSEQPTGMYILKTRSNEGWSTQKLIRQ